MSKNNSSVGRILLGSALAVAGLAAFVYFSDDAREKVEGTVNRERAKYLVRNKMNAPQAFVDAVDNLSDSEVTTLMRSLDKAGDAGENILDTVSDAVDKSRDLLERVADYFDN